MCGNCGESFKICQETEETDKTIERVRKTLLKSIANFGTTDTYTRRSR